MPYERLSAAACVALASLLPACSAESPELAGKEPAGGKMVAFTGASIWDGTGREVVGNATLLVRDGRVVDVGAGAPPPGVETIALDDMWVVPGIINSHGHVTGRWASDDVESPADRIVEELKLNSRYGVTTVVSLGDEPPEAFTLRDAPRGTGPGRARLYVAGPVVADTTPHEAAAQAANNAAAGVDWLKLRVDDNLGTARKMPWPAVEAVLDVGDDTGIPVATHIFYYEDAMRLIESGSGLIAHSVRDRPVDEAFVNAIRNAGICYVPTLVREVSTFVYAERPAFFDDPFFLKAAKRSEMQRLSEPEYMAGVAASQTAEGYRKALVQAKENLRLLQEAGVPIAFGTDSGPPGRFPGYFEHVELTLMSDAGLTPAQILLSATSVAADCMGLPDLGSLEEGKWADFLVLEENPLADIAAMRSLRAVYIAGREASFE